jgi:hypothetical protein
VGCELSVVGKWKTKLTAKPVNKARSAATATKTMARRPPTFGVRWATTSGGTYQSGECL